MGKSSAPAPDYTGAAAQTAAGNMDNLKYQTQANRPDMVTPWGTSTWTQGTNADGSGNNQWSNVVKLSPDQQAALDAQQKVQANQSNLAQTLQGQVASTMAGGFKAPDFGSAMSGVPSVQSNFSSFNPSGVGGVNQSSYNPYAFTGGAQAVNQNFRGGPQQQTQFNSGTQALNQNFSSGAPPVNTDPSAYTSGAGSTNLNAPQFSDANAQAGASAAYNASTELLKDQWGQDTSAMDSKLRLQGLTPGSEAYDNAMQNLTRTQAQQQNQIANQSVVTGNNMANQNYASALQGYQSGNAAQNQAFGQGITSFGAGNTAIGQQYGQDLGAAQFNNTATNQQFGNSLSAYNAQNQAANTQFGNNLQGYQATNDARTQALNNGLSQYQAQLQGQNAYNTAQGQAYNQALAGYGANATAQQNSNAAQAQAYQQALQNYQTDYAAKQNAYNMPLNSMNAVLTGQQVQNPTFNGFSAAGYTPGADYSGAASALGQWNSAQSAQQNAQTGQTLGTAAGLAAMFMMSDARLKENIFRVGNTEGGHAWYVWDWKDGSGKGRGVIAQDIIDVPGAVHMTDSGYLCVDYAAIQ
jgi:hypothetical protein